MKNRVSIFLTAVAAFAAAALSASAMTVTPTTDLTALKNAFGGDATLTISGVTINNGAAGQFGTYTGFNAGPVTIGDGVVLSNGYAYQTTAAYQSTNDSPNSNMGVGGTPEFNAYGPGHITNFYGAYDVASVTVNFNLSTASSVIIPFLFGSVEYPDYVNEYTDSFLAFLDGTNAANQIAFDSAGNAVQVGSSFASALTTADVNSAFGGRHGILSLTTQTGTLSAGAHEITFEVGDINDHVLDSAVFIGSLSTGTGGGSAPVTLSSNDNLAGLTISSGTLTPVFSVSGTIYTVTVPSSVTSETVTPVLSDSNATFNVSGGSVLNPGLNTITVTVTAQDGITVKVYTIFVTRQGGPNANLSNLAVSSGTLSPAFASSGTSYTVTVPNSVTSETLTPTLSDSNASFDISGGDVLNVGPNTITVTVTAQDGVTTKVYAVVVTRLPSSNADLADLQLSVGTLNPMFDPEMTQYTANVPQDATNETVTPVLSDSTATFVVTGGDFLNPGPNAITVAVTAQDGTTAKTYVVLVNRMEDHSEYYFSTVALGGQQTPQISASGNAAAPVSPINLSEPTEIALSASGNLYIADWANTCIYKMTADGVTTILAGDPTMSGTADGIGGLFVSPFGVAVDASENVYVTDAEAATIRKITPDGVVTTLAGSPGVTGTSDGTGPAARFNMPAGIAVDVSGNIYVADALNNTIRKITPSGIVATLAGNPAASGSADGVGIAARFNRPDGVAVDSNGNLFVADLQNNTIRKVAPDGTVSTYAGVAGAAGFTDGTSNVAQFNNPTGVALDAYGNLYVTDNGNNTIREVTVEGTVLTLGGFPGVSGMIDGMGNDARFNSPVGLTSDANGTLYITDQNNSRVAKGIPLQVTGSATVVNGKVTFTGSANPMGLFAAPWIEYGTDTFYRSENGVQGIGSGTNFEMVTGSATVGLVNNTTYRYRLGLANSDGMFFGATHFFTDGPSCLVRDAVVSGSLVTFNASVNPNGFAGPLGKRTNVQVYWEYGTVKGKYTTKTTAQPIGTGTNWVAVTGTHGRTGLTKAIYHFRVAMSSTVGITYGPDQVFSNKAPSVTYGQPAATGSGGVVSTAVLANDLETTVYFQYGLTTAYASGTTPSQDVGNWWQLGVPVSGTLTGLLPNTLYHYRIVTINALGTVYGPDQWLATQPRYGTAAVDSITDVAPGIPGATFKTFGNPAINDTDHVAFQATVSGSKGSGIGATNNVGIWADSGTASRVLLARTGALAPGYLALGTVGTFAGLSDPVYANDDTVAFLGTLSTTGTVTTINNKGIWLATGAALPALVARAGDYAPDASGSIGAASPVFKSFSQIVLPDHGGVVFTASLMIGVGGVSALNNTGLWAQDIDGTLRQVGRVGDGVTIGSQIKGITGVTIFNAPASASGQTRHFNSNGDLLLKLNLTGASGGILRLTFPTVTGSLYDSAMLALVKDAAPGIAGCHFSALGNPVMNDSGHVAFQATVSGIAGSGIVPANNVGIWADSGTDGRLLMARTGVAAAGYVTGTSVGTFATLSDPVYANDDGVAFAGTLVKGGTGTAAITGSNNAGIWLATGTDAASRSLKLVARTGDPAPDATGTASSSGPIFGAFKQFVLPNQGGVVLLAGLVTGRGGVTGTNSQAIWAQDAAGVLKQIIRTGDGLTVNGKARLVSALSIFSAPAAGTGQTRHFNDAGDLLYKITFTDGSISIVQSVFP